MGARRVGRGRAMGRAHRYGDEDVPERTGGRTCAPGRVLRHPDPPTLGCS